MDKGLAVIYDRASTKKQDENYTRQDVKRIGVEIAKRHGFATEPEPRLEIKSGEKLENREVMLGILKDVRDGKVAAIITPNFTRLSRDSDMLDGMIIRQTCRENGVVVIDFTGRTYDFEKDSDADMALFELWFGARDKRQMMSNMMRGAKERARQGKYMGGAAPFGYQLLFSGEVNKRGKPLMKRAIEPTEAEVVREIFRLYHTISAYEIARRFNNEGKRLTMKYPGKSGTSRPFAVFDVLRILRNPLYAGWVRWNTETRRARSQYLKDLEPQVHFDPSLQIVSQAEFDRAQRRLSERAHSEGRATPGRYPFSPILKCRECGGRMGANIHYREYVPLYRRHFYRCSTHAENPAKCAKGQSVTAFPVASAVIPFVATWLKEKTRVFAALDVAAAERMYDEGLAVSEAKTRAELEGVKQGLARMMDAISSGLVEEDEAKEKLASLRAEKERLTQELQGLAEKKDVSLDIVEAVKIIQGDLEGVLWKMFEKNQPLLGRVLKLFFEEKSVAVESFGEPSARRGKLIDYKVREDLSKLSVVSAHSAVPS